jgi:hypothetical protein
MTANEFRAIALSLPDTVESAHMNHPDFRVRGKIFATLGYPDCAWGVVCLTAAQQALVCEAEPEVFVPVKGAWGRAGNTQVYLGLARKRGVRAALRSAWLSRAPKKRAGAARKPPRKPRDDRKAVPAARRTTS